MSERATSGIKDFVIPVGTLLTLVWGVYSYGQSNGRTLERLDRMSTDVSALTQSLSAWRGFEIETKATLRSQEKESDRLEQELALLTDYVEGRIGRVPYRRGAK